MDNTHKARKLIESMIELFKPDTIVRKQLERGELASTALAA
jgi:hypothetical protein